MNWTGGDDDFVPVDIQGRPIGPGARAASDARGLGRSHDLAGSGIAGAGTPLGASADHYSMSMMGEDKMANDHRIREQFLVPNCVLAALGTAASSGIPHVCRGLQAETSVRLGEGRGFAAAAAAAEREKVRTSMNKTPSESDASKQQQQQHASHTTLESRETDMVTARLAPTTTTTTTTTNVAAKSTTSMSRSLLKTTAAAPLEVSGDVEGWSSRGAAGQGSGKAGKQERGGGGGGSDRGPMLSPATRASGRMHTGSSGPPAAAAAAAAAATGVEPMTHGGSTLRRVQQGTQDKEKAGDGEGRGKKVGKAKVKYSVEADMDVPRGMSVVGTDRWWKHRHRGVVRLLGWGRIWKFVWLVFIFGTYTMLVTIFAVIVLGRSALPCEAMAVSGGHQSRLIDILTDLRQVLVGITAISPERVMDQLEHLRALVLYYSNYVQSRGEFTDKFFDIMYLPCDTTEQFGQENVFASMLSEPLMSDAACPQFGAVDILLEDGYGDVGTLVEEGMCPQAHCPYSGLAHSGLVSMLKVLESDTTALMRGHAGDGFGGMDIATGTGAFRPLTEDELVLERLRYLDASVQWRRMWSLVVGDGHLLRALGLVTRTFGSEAVGNVRMFASVLLILIGTSMLIVILMLIVVSIPIILNLQLLVSRCYFVLKTLPADVLQRFPIVAYVVGSYKPRDDALLVLVRKILDRKSHSGILDP